MTIFVALTLTILAFAAAAFPFFQRKLRLADLPSDDKPQELSFKRDTTFSMLKELEFDYQSGILTADDYQELKERYTQKGMGILKDIDSLEKDNDIDAAIEKQILQLRQRTLPPVEDEIEEKIANLRRGKSSSLEDVVEQRVGNLHQRRGQFCPQCGARHQPNDRFCIQCGTKLG